MSQQHKSILVLAALSGLVAVAAGAFGAHGLTDPQARDWVRTGASYQLIHAVASLAVLGLGLKRSGLVVSLFLGGGLVFASTLYAMALGAPHWLGAITPLGGLSLLGGWASLAWQAYRHN
jgi:uncharacterized membrane protein YgdD (TMEM256/DUF423 family)